MANEIPAVVVRHPRNTDPRPPTAPDDSSSALDETFTNFSATTFMRDYSGCEYQKGLSGPSITPGPVLDNSTNDTQEYAISQMLSWLDQGPLAVYCCWRNPVTGYRFGVKLYAKFQMFGLGPRPVWYVMADKNPAGSEPQWLDSGSDPADPYTWPTIVGFNISAIPNSSHTALSVKITINDLSTPGR